MTQICEAEFFIRLTIIISQALRLIFGSSGSLVWESSLTLAMK